MTAPPAPPPALAPRRHSRIAILTVIGSGLALTMLQRGLLTAVAESPPSRVAMLLFDLPHWLLWLPLAPLIVAAARRWPFRESPARSLAVHLVIATLLAVVHTAALSAVLPLLGGLPLERSFVRSAAGLLSWRLAVDAFVYATLLATTLALDSAARARADGLAAMRSAADATKAQLLALQMQIQPHFLFNALNTAAMMARSGNAAAADLITRLSELLRELVVERPDACVPLGEEISFVERYLAIERARFGERLRISISTSPEALDVLVPRLLLQPLVENALHHGLSRSPTSGAIGISATIADGWLTLSVTDDGPGPAPGRPPAPERLGLGNTRSRLAALYGDRFELSLAATGDGAVAVLRLPTEREAA